MIIKNNPGDDYSAGADRNVIITHKTRTGCCPAGGFVMSVICRHHILEYWCNCCDTGVKCETLWSKETSYDSRSVWHWIVARCTGDWSEPARLDRGKDLLTLLSAACWYCCHGYRQKVPLDSSLATQHIHQVLHRVGSQQEGRLTLIIIANIYSYYI